MEPLLDLPIDQFFGALDELGLDPERRSDLLREYRRRNSAFSPVYGLLNSVADEDAAAGMQRADIVPISRPEGMSVFEAIRSGDWRLAVPQGALDAVGNVAGALDVPAAAAAGLIPREDMVSEALNAAGVVMGLGGLLARPAGSFGMGGRVADSAAETPAQQVARLLREGRAADVTDDLMAQADPQEMYQLYVSGETGMDLPMDEASRMARAAEMGFDAEAYHGTGADFPAFDGRAYSASGFGTHMGAQEAADQILRNRTSVYQRMNGAPDYDETSAILPLRANTQGALRVADTNTWQPDQVMGAMAWSDDPLASAAYERINADPSYPRFGSEIERAAFIQRQLENENVPGFVYNNAIEGGGDSYAIFNPRNIRSRFARFDPRLSHLANLNAANIDPLTGAAAMGASQQQQDPLASLRAYLAATGGVLGR